MKYFKVSDNRSHKYCSYSCHHDTELQKQRKNKLRKVVCNICNKEFSTFMPNACYCSPKCQKIGQKTKHYTYKKAPVIELTCVECGNKFMTGIVNRKFCSKDCVGNYWKRTLTLKNKATLFTIFERDNFTCVYCGKSSIKDGVKLCVDHIYPRKHDGKNDLINFITSCQNCNSEKSSTILNEEIILTLWKRNKDFFNKNNTKPYAELIKYFNDHYKKSE
jgi:hypothetical protein